MRTGTVPPQMRRDMRHQQTVMKNTLAIPETFLGVGYTKDRAGLPLEAVRVPVPRPEADQVPLDRRPFRSGAITNPYTFA